MAKPDYDQDLLDASDALESLVQQLPKLKLEAKVDILARIKGIAKNAKTLDETIKGEIKTKLKGKAGVVLGELFKAKLNIVPVDRLDQKALKEDKPAIHAAYVRTDEDQRVTTEPR